jgi:hypothetical protein
MTASCESHMPQTNMIAWDSEVAADLRTRKFVGLVRRGLSRLADPDDPKIRIVLAVLEVRLEAIGRRRSEGLDEEGAFRLATQTIDQAVSALTGPLGGGVRAVVCWAICKVGTMGPTPEERLRRAIGL